MRFRFLPILALLFVVGPCAAAHAHAMLATSEPRDGATYAAPPRQATLTFGEAVTPVIMRLLRPNGEIVRLRQVSAHDGIVTVELPNDGMIGASILNWRVMSADGHPVGGTITFTVGGGAPSQARLDTFSHRLLIWGTGFLLWAALVLAVGTSLFRAFITRDLAPVPAGMARAAALVGILDIPFATIVQAADALGTPLAEVHPADVWQMATTNAAVWSLGLKALSLVASLGALRRDTHVRKLAGTAAVLLAVAVALQGHAAVAPPRWIMQPAIALHVLGMLFWLGSLPCLLALLIANGGWRKGFEAFSQPIFVTSLLLVLTGTAMATVQLGHWDEVWRSGYGLVLAAKLLLVAPMFALGAANRAVLVPALLREDTRGARLRICRSIAAEIVLGFSVLGIVGLWRFTPPPREMSAVTATVDGLQFHAHGVTAMANLRLTPAKVGAAHLFVSVLNLDGSPREAQAVSLALFEPTGRLDPIRCDAKRQTAATWLASDLNLAVPGRWTVRVDIVTDDFEVTSIKTIFDVAK